MRIEIISHDAGGASILASWAEKNKENHQLSFVLEGPAIKIFQEKGFFSFPSKGALELVLAGTSIGNNLEKEAILKAKKKGIKTASFLDHWMNYKERFLYQGKLVFPDEIWVGDEDAFQLALKEGLPKQKLKQVLNPFWEAFEGLARDCPVKGIILYVSERSRSSLKRAKDVVNCLNGLGISVIIRPHPAEKKSDFKEAISGKKDIVLSGNNLFEDIKKSSIVVGFESMALVCALKAGRKVFSFIPPSKSFSLPFTEIIRLNSIQELRKYLWKN